MLKTLKNLFKQDKEKFVVPKSVQSVIPIKTIWEDGIFLVGKNKYAKTFKFEDINYAVASREDKEAMFLEYSELLNSLDSGATTKITINNRRLNKADFEQTILIPMADDGLDKYRKEYNKMLLEKATGANSIVQDKYVTVSVSKKNIEEARNYVARYKTRKDGSRYKAWRCNEAAKHGSPHIDKAGNQVGCTGLSIRNEDATHIMYLVTKSLKYNRNKIINNLTAVIQSIIAMDTTGTDVLKLQEQIKKIEGKRANLIDLYMSNLINKDEFTATRASCDAEIEELQSIIESVDKQREMIEQQQQLLKEIEDAIKEIVSGVEYEDEFYKHILDKMVVQDKDNIDVYLNLLPMKWSYTVAKASKKAVASEWNISEASLPMSVSRAFSSG